MPEDDYHSSISTEEAIRVAMVQGHLDARHFYTVWDAQVVGAEQLDHEKFLEHIDTACLSLGRYAKQQLSFLWDLPVRELYRQIELLKKLADLENQRG